MSHTFSLVINHARHRDDRRKCLVRQLDTLGPGEPSFFLLNDDPDLKPAGPTKVAWALRQWEWSRDRPVSHHMFMSDDLDIVPRVFWPALRAMVTTRPNVPMGLLANHPRAVALALAGTHGYFTNSWLVGPCMILPHAMLADFLPWFKALPPDEQARLNDDSTLNRWVSERGGGRTWHPLPTIIEHRGDIETTWVSGDQYSRERVSWRQIRACFQGPGHWDWRSVPHEWNLEQLTDPEFWAGDHPLLPVGE